MGGIKSGATGCVLVITGIIIAIIAGFLAGINPLLTVILAVVGGIILAIGILLIAIGAMKLGKLYKDTVSKVAGIIGLIAAILTLVGTILAVMIILAPGIAGAASIMNLVATIITGVFFILLGVAFIVIRKKTGYSGLSLGTGIMTLITGGMYSAVLAIIVFIATIILIPTAIMAAILFLKAEGDSGEVKEAKKLAVKAVEAKPKKQKPADVEAEVYKYVKSHPSGIDVADCAESLGVSEGEVQKSINALVKKGKLELG